MTETRYPAGPGSTTAEGEPGFAAVRSRFGNDMVQRMLNWPKLAEVYTAAQYGDAEMVENEAEKARREMQRARTDREFAIDQAERIARRVPKQEWAIVSSVSQLRREWEFE